MTKKQRNVPLLLFACEDKALQGTEKSGLEGKGQMGLPLKWLGICGQKLEHIAMAVEEKWG